MIIIYNKTSIGYSHINKGTVCQDYSEHYISEDYRIVTACDGHGGSLYVRSDRGSKLASQAVIEVISKYSYFDLHSLIESDALNKIKLEVFA